MKFLLPLLLLISAAWNLAARPSLSVQPDIRDYASLQMAFYDDPDALLEWLKEHIGELDPAKDPKAWVGAILMLGNVMNEIADIPGGRASLQKARDLAEAHKLYAPMLLLQGTIDSYATVEKTEDLRESSFQDEQKTFKANIQRAQELKSPRIQAIYMVGYAGFLLDHGETNESLRILIESARIIEQDPSATVFDKIEFKGLVSKAFIRHGQSDRALGSLRDIDELCQKTFLRFLCSRNSTDLADLYFKQGTPESLEQAEGLAERSLHAGIDSKFAFPRRNFYLLGEIALAQKDYAKARKRALAFLGLIEGDNFDEDKRVAYMMAARAYHGSGEDTHALQYIEKAEKLTPADNILAQARLQETKYAIQRALGQLPEALASLERFTAAHKQLDEKSDKETYQKLMVQMGLAAEEQRVKILSQENEIQDQKIKETERIRVVAGVVFLLLMAVIGLMIQSQMRSRQMRKSRRKMQRILDHIDEGILIIDGGLQIDSEYSRHLHNLLNDPNALSRRPVLDVLLKHTQLSSEERSIIMETLKACLNEDNIAWEMNGSKLPTELVMQTARGSRPISLHWQPIIDEEGIIRDVILSLRDESQRKRLEAEVRTAQQTTAKLTQRVSELINADIHRSQMLFDELDQILATWAEPGARSALLPRLHTVKGLARTLGLKKLSQVIHVAEESLLQKRHDLPQELTQLTGEYRHVMRQIFHQTEARVQNLAGVVSSLQPGLMQQLNAHHLAFAGLILKDEWLAWSAQDSRDLEFVLTHALNNAVDHGFVRPQQKGQSVPALVLHIEAIAQGTSLILRVRDNGIGLDWSRFAQLAQEKNFVPAPGQTLADVLFLEGVSTAVDTTLTSGRGVGLAAIRAISQERRGSVHISDSDLGSGTMLTIELPVATKKAS